MGSNPIGGIKKFKMITMRCGVYKSGEMLDGRGERYLEFLIDAKKDTERFNPIKELNEQWGKYAKAIMLGLRSHVDGFKLYKEIGGPFILTQFVDVVEQYRFEIDTCDLPEC